MNRFKLEKVIDAPLEIVWAAADFTRSAGPYPMTVRDPGDPERNFIGFTRAVSSGNRIIIEHLLSVDPMKQYTYQLTDGVPVKDDYLGKVDFIQIGEDTKITWTVSFIPKFPGTGWFVALLIKNSVGKIIDHVAAECLAISKIG